MQPQPINMDLLCTENIMNEHESDLYCVERTQQQQQTKQAKANKLSSASSPFTNTNSCSSSSCSSGYNSASSSQSCVSCSSGSISVSGNYSCSACCRKRSSSSSGCGSSSGNNANAIFYQAQSHAVAAALPTVQQKQQQQQPAQHIGYNSSSSNSSTSFYLHNLSTRHLDYVNKATTDPTFLSDRVLENALKAEEKRPPTECNYFKSVQKDITPEMRKIVAEWMMEVCAEEKCQEEVVLLALDYMDRFLTTKSVRKTNLQILAAACLLLASKLREPSCRALSAELLVFYTDNSICKSDLIKWELIVLSRLGWDLSSVTPLDFLELLLIRLPIRNSKYPDLNMDKVKQHAQAFISLAAKEHYFSMYTASTIAASSIAAALNGLNWHSRTGQQLNHLLDLLTDLTSVQQDFLNACMLKMEAVFEEHSRNLLPYTATAAAAAANSNSSNNNYRMQQQTTLQSQQQQQQQQHHAQQQQQMQLQQQQQQHMRHHSAYHHGSLVVGSANGSVVLLPDLTQTCKMQANAHKDVQDIKF